MEGDIVIETDEEEQVIESGGPSDSNQPNINEDERNAEDYGDPEPPNENATVIQKREYVERLNTYSKEMVQTLEECGYQSQELWIEFTTAFRPSAIKLLTGTQQTSWIRLLKCNGVHVTQVRGFAKWKALKQCLLSRTFPAGSIRPPSQRQSVRPAENIDVGNTNDQRNNDDVNDQPRGINNPVGTNVRPQDEVRGMGAPTPIPNPELQPAQERRTTRERNVNNNQEDHDRDMRARHVSGNRSHQRERDESPEHGERNRNHDIAPHVTTRDNRRAILPSRGTNAMNSRHTSANSNININNINSMMKAYQGRSKFKGTFDDDFEGALETFETYSSIYQLNEDEKAKAFPFIIDAGALSQFTSKFARRNYTYAEVVTSFREWYTSEEQRTRLLLDWQNPSLLDAMRQDPEKSELEIFRKLVDKLTAIQRQLHPSYREDRFLRDQLVVSADVTQLRNSLREKVPRTAQEAINRIASQLSNEPKSAGAHFVDDNEYQDMANYGLGRRFGGEARKNYHRAGRKQKNRDTFRRDLASVKGCWVCGQSHHARDKHPKSEVLGAINKFRNSQKPSAFTADHFDDFEWALIDDDDSDLEDEIQEQVRDPVEQDKGSLIASYASDHDQAMVSFFANSSYLHSISTFKNGNEELFYNTEELSNPFVTDEKLIHMDSAMMIKDPSSFAGVIIDTGANRSSVMCYNQYKLYCQLFKAPERINRMESKGIKGLFSGSFSLGTAIISIPFTGLQLVIEVKFRIMEQDCESLFSLKDLKENGLNLDVQRDKILYKGKEQSLTIVNDFLVHKWSPVDMPYVLYTYAELRKLHRNFGHPTVSALRKVLRRANPISDDASTKSAIADIVQSCRTCQVYSSKPRRFKLTMGTNDLQFNHIIAVDIMYINGKPILHVVDEATHYMAALFLRKVSSEETWKGILKCWMRVYLGPPDHIRVDQGSNFVSKHFKGCVEAEGISIIEAPVESPSTMSHVERYHAPLRTAYLKIRDCMPRSESDPDCLQMAVKSVNDTIGPEGLCPTLLVYGSIPRPARVTSADTQLARAKAIDQAREEVLKEIAKKKIAFGLRNCGSPKRMEQEQTLASLPAGSPVLVYRNADKKWEGPFPFVSIDGNTAVVQLPHGRKIFRSTAVKSTLPPTDEDKFNMMPSLPPTIDEQHCTDYTFINGNVEDSREVELQGLLEAGVFEVVHKSKVPTTMRVYGTRWVDGVKILPNGMKSSKSRLVAQNYRDKSAADILTKSPTISRVGQRVAIMTAALFPENQAYVRDISQAYIQSKTALEREVFLRPPTEMGLQNNYLLLAKRPLYGIPESGLHWFLTYQEHHKNELKMNESLFDKCLLYTSISKPFHGITAIQVDDSFGHGTSQFLNLEEEKCKCFQRFKSKPRHLINNGSSVPFNGSNITKQTGTYKVNQSDKLRNLTIPHNEEEANSIRALLQYIGTCTRPDICSPSQMMASKMSKITPTIFKRLTKLVTWANDTADIGLIYKSLDMESLRFMLFTDSSFANTSNLKSQLGFVVVLSDKNNNANIVHYGSTRCYRVTRSVPASELHALVYGFDNAYCVQSILEEVLQVKIPIDVFIDSKTLFNVVAKHGDTKEKRLQIDIYSIRESHYKGEIRNIYWIPGVQNVADALTKESFSSKHSLWNLMTTNKIKITPFGWNKKKQTNEVNIS